jgi:hypothetical protein
MIQAAAEHPGGRVAEMLLKLRREMEESGGRQIWPIEE